MATLKQINDAIQKVEPCVELVRGQGYHYYVFDNVVTNNMGDLKGFLVGDRLVFDDESINVCYLNQQRSSRWIEDGIDFGRRVRNQHGLPEQGEA